MMKFALFLGCTIPARLQHYEFSSRAVLEKLGVGLEDIKEFNCCGYPLRNIDFKVFLLSSARNLALAERKGLPIVALCQCCYGSLKKADALMKEHPSLRKEMNETLEKEGLRVEGRIEVKHLLTVLYQDVGLEAIQKRITKNFKGLKIAAHYGCHALRPSKVVQFDHPASPSLFERLVEATGARSVDWVMRLECCGAPLLGVNDDLSKEMTLKKLRDGREGGADCLCTACPYCQIQFDTVQKTLVTHGGFNPPLPSLLYPQLLGLSLGIAPDLLGLSMNQIPIPEIVS